MQKGFFAYTYVFCQHGKTKTIYIRSICMCKKCENSSLYNSRVSCIIIASTLFALFEFVTHLGISLMQPDKNTGDMFETQIHRMIIVPLKFIRNS